MTGEKSSDISSRLSVKRGTRLISKSSKPSSNTVVTPPKAAPNARKDDIHRRRSPFNDMLKHGGREDAEPGNGTPLLTQVNEASALLSEEGGLNVEMADRIVELERALAFVKEEKASLKEELGKVKQQAQVDRDTVQVLRHQLAETNRNTRSSPASASIEEGQDSETRPFIDHSNEDITRQNYELRYRLAQLQEQLASQNSINHNHATSHEEAEWDELRSRLHATEKESQGRLQQLVSLKSSISSLTRIDAQVTDSELGESFSQLANRVREWVVSNFRRSKLHFDNIPSETQEALRSIILDYETVDAMGRISLYQAIVSSAFMQVLQEPIAMGLPEGPLATIRQCAGLIQGAETEFHEWRRATIRAMEKSGARNVFRQGRDDALHRLAGEIGHLLFTLTSVSLTLDAQSVLIGILNTAADLQGMLVRQKARYQVVFFRNQKKPLDFNDRRMESVNDLDNAMNEDGVTITKRKFLFCVFPCLEKFGDERGEHLETSNVLSKARVCCGSL